MERGKRTNAFKVAVQKVQHLYLREAYLCSVTLSLSQPKDLNFLLFDFTGFFTHGITMKYSRFAQLI